MGLKAVVDSVDDLSEDVKSLYTKDTVTNKFNLQVDGFVPKNKLDEFRDNNIALTNDLKKFTDLGINIDDIKKAKETQRKLEEKQLMDAGEIDKVVQNRVAGLKTEYETKLTDTESKLNKSNNQLSILMIDNAARKSATDSGVLGSAVDDVLLRVRNIFAIKDGKVVAERDGQVVYGKDGVNSLSITEYVGSLKESASHLFESSKGTGSQGGGGNRGGSDTSKLSATQKISMGLEQRSK